MNIDDLVLKYAVMMPIRFKINQKFLFISEVAKEYEMLGYETKAVIDKKRGGKSLNLLIGDLKNADTIFISNYDTPQRNLARSFNYYPFDGVTSFASSFFPFYTPLLIGAITAFVIMWKGLPNVDFTNNFIQSFYIITLLVLTISISTILTKGIANKQNFNRNTSGVIGNLLLAEKFAGQKNIAFVLTDMGCFNNKGDRMLQDALPKTLKDRKVVLLDCIGKGPRIGVGYRQPMKKDAETVIKNVENSKTHITEMDESKIKYTSLAYYEKGMIVSTGKQQYDTFFVEDVCRGNDNNVDQKIILEVVESVYKTFSK